MFNSTIYTAAEGMDHKVKVTVLASGAVNESSFSVRVIAKDGTATSEYIHAQCSHTQLCT